MEKEGSEEKGNAEGGVLKSPRNNPFIPSAVVEGLMNKRNEKHKNTLLIDLLKAFVEVVEKHEGWK